MKTPERTVDPQNENKFKPGMVARLKNTSEHHINGEYMPIGITGIVEKVESGKVFVAYVIPGKSIRRDGAQSTIFDFNPSEIEELKS